MSNSEQQQLIKALLADVSGNWASGTSMLSTSGERPMRDTTDSVPSTVADRESPSGMLLHLLQADSPNQTSVDRQETRGDAFRNRKESVLDATQLISSLGVNPERPVRNTVEPKNEERSGDSGQSIGRSILGAIQMATGLGSIATGLMALFGGRRTADQIPEPVLYNAPESISVEAALGADRKFDEVSYGATGLPRASTNTDPGLSRSNERSLSPVINVNVSAMDSRSFLDRSDDIARAVREAMLHSHSLNDVVSEL